jgi:hypothetical protein
MSTASPGNSERTGIPALDDPNPRRVSTRHPLGLPAGSVRAMMALGVLGMLWAIVLATKEGHLPLFFVYLLYLLILILAHYFASHGVSIARIPGERNPLGLPRGSVRFLMLAGIIGLVVWFFYHQGVDLDTTARPSFIMPLILLGAFITGWLITAVVRTFSGGQLPFWFQDIQAWFAIVGMLGLIAEMVILIFINSTVVEDLKIDPTQLEWGLTGVIGFYFGARS